MSTTLLILAASTSFVLGGALVILLLLALLRKGFLRGEIGYTGAMGAMGEPASMFNLCGVLSRVQELDTLRQYNHLDTYIIDGAYWTYMDRTPTYEQCPDMVRSPDNKKFVVVGFVNGRSAETNFSVGDSYAPSDTP